MDPEWLAEQLAELERLADDGDTLEVVGKLRNVVRESRRLGPPAPPAAVEAPSLEVEPRVEPRVEPA